MNKTLGADFTNIDLLGELNTSINLQCYSHAEVEAIEAVQFQVQNRNIDLINGTHCRMVMRYAILWIDHLLIVLCKFHLTIYFLFSLYKEVYCPCNHLHISTSYKLYICKLTTLQICFHFKHSLDEDGILCSESCSQFRVIL